MRRDQNRKTRFKQETTLEQFTEELANAQLLEEALDEYDRTRNHNTAKCKQLVEELKASKVYSTKSTRVDIIMRLHNRFYNGD